MKSLLSLCIFLLITCAACNQEKQNSMEIENYAELNQKTINAITDKFKLPKNTNVSQNGNEFILQASETVLFASTTSQGIIANRSIGIACSCTGGTGTCSAIHRAGDFGCLMDADCTTCNSRVTRIGGTPVAGTLIGALDLEEGISIFTTNELNGIFEGQGTTLYNKDIRDLGRMVELPDVQRGVQAFRDELYTIYDLNSKHVEVLVNIYGTKAGLEIPVQLYNELHATGARLIGGDSIGLSCYCSKGSGDCTKKSTFGVTVCSPKSNCQECTLE